MGPVALLLFFKGMKVFLIKYGLLTIFVHCIFPITYFYVKWRTGQRLFGEVNKKIIFGSAADKGMQYPTLCGRLKKQIQIKPSRPRTQSF